MAINSLCRSWICSHILWCKIYLVALFTGCALCLLLVSLTFCYACRCGYSSLCSLMPCKILSLWIGPSTKLPESSLFVLSFQVSSYSWSSSSMLHSVFQRMRRVVFADCRVFLLVRDWDWGFWYYFRFTLNWPLFW